MVLDIGTIADSMKPDRRQRWLYRLATEQRAAVFRYLDERLDDRRRDSLRLMAGAIREATGYSISHTTVAELLLARQAERFMDMSRN